MKKEVPSPIRPAQVFISVKICLQPHLLYAASTLRRAETSQTCMVQTGSTLMSVWKNINRNHPQNRTSQPLDLQ
jgi:hypothetical protein